MCVFMCVCVCMRGTESNIMEDIILCFTQILLKTLNNKNVQF